MKIKSIFDILSKSKYLISMLLGSKYGKKFILIKFAILLFDAVIGIIGLIVPGLIINELMFNVENGVWNISALLYYLALLLAVPAVYRILLIPIRNMLFHIEEEININLDSNFELFVAKMDYETLEDPNLQGWRERVSNTVLGATEIVDLIGNIISSIISFAVSFSIITYLNPLLIVLILVIVYINSRMVKWQTLKRFELREEFSKHQRKNWSLTYMLIDFSYAKEIRLYNIAEFLLKKLNSSQRDMNATTFKNNQNRNKVNLVLYITEFIQSAAVYVYLIYKLLIGALSIGYMTICLSAAQRFSGSVSSIVNAYMALSERTMEIKEWQDFLNIPVKEKKGTMIPVIDENSYIEFHNVSFQYPGSDIFAIKNLNLKLSCTKKLCIVGENGSGKSTFIKLLLRLYEPTSGEILLNGVNITEYNYELYTKLFAPVFQDFSTYELTLKENVALDEKCDDVKFHKACVSSNIQSLIDKLAKGAETQIGKEIDPEGIEPSGGEGQRIAIARACYHGGEIFILDEPTAALDPMAEYEIYTQFSNIITDKCAILITHRLSAVQLADNVAVFDDGRVAEYGTHSELYAKGGIYTEMFDKQAKFYRDEPEQ